MERQKNKSRHFTLLEKKLFLNILRKYKHIVEVKKSDSSTLKVKDAAWAEICKEYNASQYVNQERNIQQLKKFWTNIKQNQKDRSTKQKQTRVVVNKGSSIISMEINPDISAITPNVTKTVPTIYSSNYDNEETEKRETQMITYLADGDSQSIEIESSENNIITSENNHDEIFCEDINNEILDKNTTPDVSKEKQIHAKNTSQIFTIDTTPIIKDFLTKVTESKRLSRDREKSPLLKHGKSSTIYINDCENETVLRKQRIQKLLEQEMEINAIKIEHEKKICALKEQHLIKIQEQELRAATAAAEIAVLQLELQTKKNEELLHS